MLLSYLVSSGFQLIPDGHKVRDLEMLLLTVQFKDDGCHFCGLVDFGQEQG